MTGKGPNDKEWWDTINALRPKAWAELEKMERPKWMDELPVMPTGFQYDPHNNKPED